MVLLETTQSRNVNLPKVKVSWGHINGCNPHHAPYYVMVMDSRSGIEVSRKVRYNDQGMAEHVYGRMLLAAPSVIDEFFIR